MRVSRSKLSASKIFKLIADGFTVPGFGPLLDVDDPREP